MDIDSRRLRGLGTVALRGGVADAGRARQDLAALSGRATEDVPVAAFQSAIRHLLAPALERLAVSHPSLLDSPSSGSSMTKYRVMIPARWRRQIRSIADLAGAPWIASPPVLPLLARADAAPRAVAVAPVPGVGFRRLNMIYRAASAGPDPVVRAVMDALRLVAAPANPAAVP